MKIEICEQMLQSWLLNCKLCEIVQTNWTVSPLRMNEIDPADIVQTEKIMKEVQEKLDEMQNEKTINALRANMDADYFEEYLLDSEEVIEEKKGKSKSKKLNIFKKSNASQFIRQCEIDVVGAKFNNGVAERIYLVDTAFHKTGLGYHDAVATVLKKIIRALVVAIIIFGEDVPVSVVFASPKCGTTLKHEIESVVKDLLAVMGSAYPNITIELYFNEDFSEKIYEPLKKEIDNLNNGNDLFMRALNLAKVSEEHLHKADASVSKTVSVPAISSGAAGGRTRRGDNQKVVFDILEAIIEQGKMTANLLDDLKMPSYARLNFKMPIYPVLLEEKYFPYSGYDKCRFYTKELVINREKYLVCSQWIPERISMLQKWFDNL